MVAIHIHTSACAIWPFCFEIHNECLITVCLRERDRVFVKHFVSRDFFAPWILYPPFYQQITRWSADAVVGIEGWLVGTTDRFGVHRLWVGSCCVQPGKKAKSNLFRSLRDPQCTAAFVRESIISISATTEEEAERCDPIYGSQNTKLFVCFSEKQTIHKHCTRFKGFS